MNDPVIPVVLFAYARPAHLARVLADLRANAVPLILAFADGAKGAADAAAVAETRRLLRAVDWCELRLTERPANLGLGRNVLAGVDEVAAQHGAFIVWEDDLVCVPGTYAWVCAALRQYAGDERVMSVTAWTHPRVTPADTGDAAHFDARAECWVWGAWARSWRGMADETAREKMAATVQRGLPADAYGADLPLMARDETRKNIWAVRWLYHHLERGGLCLRPPWSMVEHIGFDAGATNAGNALGWDNPPLRAAPPVPAIWPAVGEHPECRELWRATAGEPPAGLAGRLKRIVRRVLPARWLAPVERRFFRVRWAGEFPDWAAARAAASGYEAPAIAARVLAAARLVRDGRAAYERDGVVFHGPAPAWPGLTVLQEAVRADGGLTVLDYGGSLGSLYFQTRRQLRLRGPLRWRVVEQPLFTSAGRREFQTEELEFHDSPAAAAAGGAPDVLLLSSVLPYLPEPLVTLRELLRTNPASVIVDRTGFVTAGRARLTVQKVPRSIYPASYPCWFLNRAEFLAIFGDAYRLVHEQRDPLDPPAGLEFRSLHLTRVSR